MASFGIVHRHHCRHHRQSHAYRRNGDFGQNLTAPATEWIAGGIPTTMMMNMERRHGEMKPVIQKALVDLQGKPFAYFAANRAEWAKNTCFIYPGPIQFYGDPELCDQPSRTLSLEQGK